MKLVTTILAVIGALALVFAAYHAVKGPLMHGHFGFEQGMKFGDRQMARMDKQLNLTYEQKKHIKDHREQHKSTMQSIMKRSMDKRKELMQEIQKSETNQSKIDLLMKDLNELEAKINQEMINGILEMKKVLTPEQFNKMNKMMEKRFPRDDKDMKARGSMEECPPPAATGPDKTVPAIKK